MKSKMMNKSNDKNEIRCHRKKSEKMIQREILEKKIGAQFSSANNSDFFF